MLENSTKKLLSLSQSGYLQIIYINEYINQFINMGIIDNNNIIEACSIC
jgi:hypothetical protein